MQVHTVRVLIAQSRKFGRSRDDELDVGITWRHHQFKQIIVIDAALELVAETRYR